MNDVPLSAEAIAPQVAAKLPESAQSLVSEFATRFWKRVPEAEFQDLELDNAVGLTLACWQRLDNFRGGPADIYIHNPDFERDGWDTTHTIVEVVVRDMPFVTDSILMELSRRDLTVHRLQNVTLSLYRNSNGISKIAPKGEIGTQAECLVFAEVDRINDEEINHLKTRIRDVLEDVQAAVTDFTAMKQKLVERISALQRDSHRALSDADQNEAIEFLDWLGNDNFTFLGYREFSITGDLMRQVNNSALGLYRRRPVSSDKQISEQPERSRSFLLTPNLLAFSKSGTRSQVHRPAYPDYVAIRNIDDNGRVVGEYGFLGLYTSPVYQQPPQQIPIVRTKIAQIMDRSGLDPQGFDGKSLAQVLNTHPRDELFQGELDELYDTAMGVTYIHERRQIRTFLRRDAYGMFFVCLVYVPRERYNTRLREGIENILRDATGALDSEFTAYFSESILVRLHFILRVDPTLEIDIDADAVHSDIIALTRDWSSELSDALMLRYGEEEARNYIRRYRDGFPAGYIEQFPVRMAVYDVGHLERLSAERPLVMRFYRPPQDNTHTVHLKLYHHGANLPLSDVVPTLENLGLRVLGGQPYTLRRNGNEQITIHDFHLQSENTLDLHEIGDRFEEAFVQIWYGRADDDSFNRLLLAAEMDWRSVMLMRAYARYMKQIRFGFSESFIADTLIKHADTASRIMDLFQARFSLRAEETIATISKNIEEALEEVELLNEDRILRRFVELINATLRTNFYQPDQQNSVHPYVSLKLNPRAIVDLPEPKPAFEIFVHSNRVEGVHLRNGKIARGGLRWSDRQEDYRTEVLGLVKAQVVKNAVIVPTGAKGGFIVRRPPADRAQLTDEAIACYQSFIRGLLDVTDNIENGVVVAPKRVRRWDEDDPYLVVAADKGTATFSDIANDISQSRDFWLDDAFASGGTNGYDHKKMGITARGAWISVQRHFREQGIDVQRDSISVLGIGDMGGDVFGNGMLLSSKLKLVAAFNHLHIFLDPNPEPQISFEERQRLFAMPRSAWSDYQHNLISEGGGVFSRSQKSILLSNEVRERFAIEADSLSPDELIHHLLQAPVDLIWNGGIGTYVKSSSESHADADDRANDPVRVNSSQLRCRAFGEGGNLGLTQKARVEFSLGGGAVNTDFIDNSAGVDCSDHEVNIKILLGQIVASGDMTLKQRNELLEAMTDDVSRLVLDNNYRQVQALSLAQRHSDGRLGEYQRFLHAMESELGLRRDLEALAGDDVLNERAQAGQGFARPEMSVLLSYAKTHIKEALLETDIHEDEAIAQVLFEEFPDELRKNYPDQIRQHRLATEIIATQTANDVVHHMGVSFIVHLREFVGGGIDDIVRAWFIAAGVYQIRERYRDIEALAHVSEDTRLHMMLALIRLGRRSSRWFLRHRRASLEVLPSTEHFGERVQVLIRNHSIITGSLATVRFEAQTNEYIEAGVGSNLAAEIAAAPAAVNALPIIDAADTTGADCSITARTYSEIGARLGIEWLAEQLIGLAPRNHWEAMERDAMLDDLATQQSQLTISALFLDAQSEDAQQRIDAWLADQRPFASAWRSVIEAAQRTNSPEFSMYAMTCRKLGDLTRMLDIN